MRRPDLNISQQLTLVDRLTGLLVEKHRREIDCITSGPIHPDNATEERYAVALAKVDGYAGALIDMGWGSLIRRAAYKQDAITGR